MHIFLQVAPVVESTAFNWTPVAAAVLSIVAAVVPILYVFGTWVKNLVNASAETYKAGMDEVKQVKRENAELSAKYLTAIEAGITLKADVVDYKRQVERLEKSVDTLQAASSADKLVAATALSTSQDLQTRLNGQREEITGLNGKVTTLTAEQTKIGNDYTAVVAERDTLKLENARLAEKVERLERQMSQLRADVDAISKPLAESNPKAAGELDAATDKSKEATP